MQKQRLELDWIGKDEERRLEPRILLEQHEHACGDASSGNLLIKGDNLLALKALEADYHGKVRCVFIDPPYNTGSAFEHYDDGIEHSLWLSLMRDRLILLRSLLSANGSIWITLDDSEMAYCKVLCDEVFGRQNFISSIVWQKRVSPANDAKYFSTDHDFILVYAKDKTVWRPNRLKRTDSDSSYYKNPDNDPRGDWNSVTYTCAKTAEERPNLYYAITNPNTKAEIWPSKTAVWKYDKKRHIENEKAGLLYWGKDGKGKTPRLKNFLTEAKDLVPRSVWLYENAGHTQEARMESMKLFPNEPFSTPKPERLLKRVVEIATDEGDIVLDSFAGSGTTGAVAQKLSRRWIMVELGDHCESHVLPRMTKVTLGKDDGGISPSVDWKGGSGFKFFQMAPSLLQKDPRGNWIINPKYDANQLANAVCKHEGFKFWPDNNSYWKQGYSSEKDFILL